ncbi:hypothetical protein PVK06_009996 [Gossypium arboreum]|uniref:Uncharacterized protein n=1 Tax=Gossypium arboreum TaxID=29729 RepID=A0ABR0QQD0_GOSAR|nr:hypothetical protein PVK06_009996 [Gossypium arboreum]
MSYMKNLGNDPNKINALVPVGFVVDHSVQVNVTRSKNSVLATMEFEFQRNKERFSLIKWGSSASKTCLLNYRRGCGC